MLSRVYLPSTCDITHVITLPDLILFLGIRVQEEGLGKRLVIIIVHLASVHYC